MSIEAMTVNELIAALEKLRDVGVSNGLGERVIDRDSRVFLINPKADDAHWITPIQVVDYDCYHEDGPWVVELRCNGDYSLEDSERLSFWLDGE